MLISVIIPVYNAEKYLSASLKSVLEQTGCELEVILIDDGSTDKSGEICDAFAKRHSQIVSVHHISNGGVSNARNIGLDNAHGEYVHFMDSDDILEKGMYDHFSKVAEEEKSDVIVCGCKRINVLRKQETLANYKENLHLKSESEVGGFLNQLAAGHKRWLLDYVWNKWYKRELLVRNKLRYDMELALGEDFLFNCNVITKVTSIYICKETYYQYYIRNSGLVTAFQSQPWIGRQKLTDAHQNLYRRYGIFEDNIDAIWREDGMLAFSALRSINSPRCTLDKKEKLDFLRNMYNSKQMEMAIYYLKKSQKKLHKLWFLIIYLFGFSGVQLVIKADQIDRFIKKQRISL